MAALPQLADELGSDPVVLTRTRHEYEKHLQVLRADADRTADDPVVRHDRDYTSLRLAVLAHKRATVLRLRDERRIDDTVLRQIQSRLDIEEVRLARRDPVE